MNKLVNDIYETGFNLLLLAIALGGSAFLVKWGIWFIVIGYLISTIIKSGADTYMYISKLVGLK